MKQSKDKSKSTADGVTTCASRKIYLKEYPLSFRHSIAYAQIHSYGLFKIKIYPVDNNIQKWGPSHIWTLNDMEGSEVGTYLNGASYAVTRENVWNYAIAICHNLI